MTTSECVALAKAYNEEVYWSRPGYFGGSAIMGWNLNTAFDLKKFTRIVYTWNEVPSIGSTIFFDNSYWPHGHVAIVHMSGWSHQLTILEQNGTGKPWDVPWDEIRIRHVTYKGVLGWYTLAEDENTRVVANTNKRFMKLLGISDNNLYEPITKWDTITILSLMFFNLTDKLKDFEKRIRKLERWKRDEN